jgi:hypothetical protein
MAAWPVTAAGLGLITTAKADCRSKQRQGGNPAPARQ